MTDRASLQKAAQYRVNDTAELEQALKDLESLEFDLRESAQRKLVDAGDAVLDFLDAKEPIKDPEVRLRVGQIRRDVSSGIKSRSALLIRHAAKSLLEGPSDVATGGLYFEWFGVESRDCRKIYRQMKFKGSGQSKPFVEKGRLHIPGTLNGENDQCFSLFSKDWPGTAVLPDRLQVSCLMGGGDRGAGTWHVGLYVGKIKVLFHPAYNGGGFRFEEVESHENLTQNQSMGFTPKGGELYRMVLDLTRMPQQRIQYKATVISQDGKSFESHLVVHGDKAGPLNEIGIVRSGRQGDTAIFDDLIIRLDP